MFYRNVDPRVKFIIALLTGVITLWLPLSQLQILIISLFIYLGIQGYILSALIHTIALIFCYLLNRSFIGLDSPIIRFFQMSTIIAVKMLPILMANYPIKKTTPGILIAALFKLKLPKEIVIPIAVILRFTPTIRSEYRKINDSMTLRGLNVNFFTLIRHPVVLIESTIVPLFMRSIKISDELAAAATLRGIENPGKKSCYRELVISKKDWAVITFFTLTIGFLVFRSIM